MTVNIVAVGPFLVTRTRLVIKYFIWVRNISTTILNWCIFQGTKLNVLLKFKLNFCLIIQGRYLLDIKKIIGSCTGQAHRSDKVAS